MRLNSLVYSQASRQINTNRCRFSFSCFITFALCQRALQGAAGHPLNNTDNYKILKSTMIDTGLNYLRIFKMLSGGEFHVQSVRTSQRKLSEQAKVAG